MRPGTRPSTRNRPSLPIWMASYPVAAGQDALHIGPLWMRAPALLTAQAPRGLPSSSTIRPVIVPQGWSGTVIDPVSSPLR